MLAVDRVNFIRLQKFPADDEAFFVGETQPLSELLGF